MTIHLPENLESPILAAVHKGRYASLDDAMAEAPSLLVRCLEQEQARPIRLRLARPSPLRHRSRSGSESLRGQPPFPMKNGTSCWSMVPSNTTMTSTHEEAATDIMKRLFADAVYLMPLGISID